MVEINIFLSEINGYFVTSGTQIVTIKINNMSVKVKYQAVLNLGEQLGIKDGDVVEAEGVLKIKGEANTQYEKDLILYQVFYGLFFWLLLGFLNTPQVPF